MKMEDHFKQTLNKAVANEPPVQDAWSAFERRVRRGRTIRLAASIAAAAAVIVAGVFVTPKILKDDRGIGIATEAPTPTSTDPQAGWRSYIDPDRQFGLQYPPSWSHGLDEGYAEFQPPGVSPAAKGDPTFFVSVAPLLPQRFDEGLDASDAKIRRDGRRYIRTETMEGDAHVVTYFVEWSSEFGCFADHPRPSDPVEPATLRVIVRGDSAALWTAHSEDGERIAQSISRIPLARDGREARWGTMAENIPVDGLSTAAMGFMDTRLSGAPEDPYLIRYMTAEVKARYDAIERATYGKTFALDDPYTRFRIVERKDSGDGATFTIETKIGSITDVRTCKTDVDEYTVAPGTDAGGATREAVVTRVAGCMDSNCPSGLFRFRE